MSYGLVASLRGTLSPKKSGVIAMTYFFSVCLADSYYFWGTARWQMVFRAFLLIIPSILGGAASLFYFCKNRNTLVNGWIIVIVSLWAIIRSLLNTAMIMIHRSEFVSMNTALNLVLKICIYLLLIYQVYVLDRKRKL